MSKINTELLELLKTLAKEVDEFKIQIKDIKEDTKKIAELEGQIKDIKEDNTSAANNARDLFKVLNLKLDLFKNLETQSREAVQQTSTAARKLTRPVFFKKLFLEDKAKYMNVLYTQEEIDSAYQEREVQAKKKEADKMSKVVTILYTKHIRANNPEGRSSAFESLYEQNITHA